MFASIFALIVFSIVLIWIGSNYRDRSDSNIYHLAGRETGVLKLAASTFTLIGGGEFITLTALSIVFGAWGIIFFVGVAIGFSVLAILVHEARKYAVSADLHSLPDYFALYFGRGGSLFSTVLASISLGALLLIQLVVGGTMLQSTTGIPVSACIIGMAIVICAYVYLGGFNGVLATDVIQAIVMLAAIVILAFAYSASDGSVAQAVANSSFPPIGDAIALILGGFFAVIGGADVWQRVLSGRNDAASKKGLFLNAGGWLVFGVFIVTLALKIQANNPGADPNTAFFLLLGGGLPEWLSAMLALLLFSSLLSTADTELFVLSVMANKELHRSNSKFGTKAEIVTDTTKLYVIVITIFVCGLALFFQQLVDIYFLLLYFMMILGPISLARLVGRGTPTLAISGIIGGVLILIILIATGLLSGAYPLLILTPPLVTFFHKGQEPLIMKEG